MIEGWSNLDKDETSFPYADICNEAVSDNKVFDKFKKDPRYIAILEHVSPEQGLKYIEGIQQYDLDQDLIESFKENDLYGGSSKVGYDLPFGNISPSTLRYIQNALDISYFYSEGELNRIVAVSYTHLTLPTILRV